MRVWIMGTGSSGNAALVESGGERILLDAGIGPHRSVEILRKMGVDLFPQSVLGLFVTHEHEDHAAKLEPMARALRAPAFLHDGIVAKRVRDRFPVRRLVPGEPVSIGPFRVHARLVPHDAPQVALRIDGGGRSLGWLTDIGHVPPSLPSFFEGCQTVLLEANYDAELLAFGPYPPKLQARVSGPLGHLDNVQAAQLAGALDRLGIERIKLAHLSKVNNTPERALRAVCQAARRCAVDVVSGPSFFEVTRPCRPGVQLGLFG